MNINRSEGNYSGHKKRYCLSMLDVTFMDGMILTYCPKAGRHVDLGLQNMSNINQLLINAQVGRAKQFSAATDKGFHIEQLIIPMHNQIALRDIQKAQNNGMSRMRITNENDIGRVTSQWKGIDFSKLLSLGLQPLGVYYRVCAVMTNALTILDYNQTALYFDCEPIGVLEDYFINP